MSDRIAHVVPAPITIRGSDRTIAEIASANHGKYSADIHLHHDATATHAFAQTHLGRLEAMRREGGGVER